MLNSRSIRTTLALLLSLGIHGALMNLTGNLFSRGHTAVKKERRVTMTLQARRVNPQTPALTGPAEKYELSPAPASKSGELKKTAPADSQRTVQEAIVRLKPEKVVKAVVREIPKPVEEPLKMPVPGRESESSSMLPHPEDQVILKESFDEPPFPEIEKEETGLIPIQEARPLYKKNPPPRYPAAARLRRYQGTVLLDVLVASSGRVNAARLYRSSGHKILDDAAIKVVGDWEFAPGKRGEQPVEMWVRVPIRFELQ